MSSDLGSYEWIAERALMAGNDVIDRKSTRLNSSHLVISYAALCLTKQSELATPPPSLATLRIPTLLIVGTDSTLVAPQQRDRNRHELRDFLEATTLRANHNLLAAA